MTERKLNVVTALAEAFGRKLSEPAIRLYVAALSQLSDAQVEHAAGISMQSQKFFPSAAELIELARTDGVSYEAKASLAFEELERALDANKPSLMSPLVAAVARQIGGFQNLHAMPIDEFRTWKRKDFLATFVTLSKENPERVAAIAGPQSELSLALLSGLKVLPSREELEAEQVANRKRLENLPRQVEATTP